MGVQRELQFLGLSSPEVGGPELLVSLLTCGCAQSTSEGTPPFLGAAHLQGSPAPTPLLLEKGLAQFLVSALVPGHGWPLASKQGVRGGGSGESDIPPT